MKKTLLLFLVALLFTSCQEELALDQTKIKNDLVENFTENECSYEISREDVQSALSIFSPTKSRSGEYVISEKTDLFKNPVFYVVNFNDGGFVLFSANKKAYPILAYSDKGRFDLDKKNAATTIWATEAENYINEMKDLPIDSVRACLSEWNNLIGKSTVFDDVKRSTHHSRGETLSDEDYRRLKTLVQDKQVEFMMQGHKVYNITDIFSGYEDWCAFAQQRAQEAVFPIYEDYWEEFCFIVEYNDTEDFFEETLQTEWHQEYPYNQYCKNEKGEVCPAGCVPVALGQIMCYLEYPPTYDWASMKNDIPSFYNIAKLLKDIGDKCEAEYTIDITLVDNKNITKGANKLGLIVKESTNRPSILPYLVTANFNGDIGHAWTETGINYSNTDHYYKCWGVTEYNRLTEFETSPFDRHAYFYVYVNWGSRLDVINGWYLNFDSHPQTKEKFYNKIYFEITKPEN